LKKITRGEQTNKWGEKNNLNLKKRYMRKDLDRDTKLISEFVQQKVEDFLSDGS
jgi:hypothetical protein